MIRNPRPAAPVTLAPSVISETATLTDYYRALLQQLASKAGVTEEGDCKALGITSCARGEGVSTVCANLAIVAAQELNKRVLLIDANVDPSHAEHPLDLDVDFQEGPGLTDFLQRRAPIQDCVRPTAITDVFVLPAGSAAGEDSSRSQPALAQLLAHLREQFGFLLVDLPIATELTDCFKIASALDGIILVVEAERVRSQVIRRAKERLQQNKASLVGVVFNKRRQHVPDWIYRRI